MKFVVEKARATKDVDFLLNVLALRNESVQLAPIFEKLGYMPLPESRNFQFAKRFRAAPRKCASSLWPRKNTNAKRIFAWISRTACTRAPVREGRSHSPNAICILSPANSRLGFLVLFRSA